jgi:4-carboxymuconolactone decarboxylase
MTAPNTRSELQKRLVSFDGESAVRPRCLALYAAAIALCDPACLSEAAALARNHGVDRGDLYEIVLQSYLFLGFPRMLEAAVQLDIDWAASPDHPASVDQLHEDAAGWYQRGLRLYNQVYDSTADRLRERVTAHSPEIFQWMILEGYGKVLSRPELPIRERELAIVAFLMMENRGPQLLSHIRGSLNVGVAPDVLRAVVHDVGEAAGEGYTKALGFLDEMALD